MGFTAIELVTAFVSWLILCVLGNQAWNAVAEWLNERMEMTSCRARAWAAHDLRCRCRLLQQPRLVETAHRSWLACDRCLGVIRGIN